LVDACCHKGGMSKEKAWDELMAREEQGGTFIGEDIMIPHARIEEITRPILAIGVGKQGILDHQSGRTVKIMILLLTPADDPKRHIEILSSVTRIARVDQWQRDVLSATKPSDILQIVNEWQGES